MTKKVEHTLTIISNYLKNIVATSQPLYSLDKQNKCNDGNNFEIHILYDSV